MSGINLGELMVKVVKEKKKITETKTRYEYVEVYRTTDGKKFECLQEAEKHQDYLNKLKETPFFEIDFEFDGEFYYFNSFEDLKKIVEKEYTPKRINAWTDKFLRDISIDKFEPHFQKGWYRLKFNSNYNIADDTDLDAPQEIERTVDVLKKVISTLESKGV